MLRFAPDGWLEFLLRPFILMDPSVGIYFEVAAPDLRFAAFIVFLAIGLSRGTSKHLSVEQGRLVVGLFVLFYVWTWASGNGRYFMAGMVFIGPLVLAAWRGLPGTLAFRNTVLVGVLALQGFVLAEVFMPNKWGVVPWTDGPGLPIEASPLREKPAVFLTISVQTYAALVPRFHAQSRWANITGQRDVVPGLPEYPRLRSLLASELPKYLVFPANPDWALADMQPNVQVHKMFSIALAAQALALTGEPCTMLKSTLAPRVPNQPRGALSPQGFWFCPVRNAPEARKAPADQVIEAEFTEAFARVEQRCPRFFPPDGGVDKRYDGLVTRNYASSDVRLFVDEAGRVRYRYFRAINSTVIGTLEEVRKGRFEVPCDKLPGRYRLPWRSD